MLFFIVGCHMSNAQTSKIFTIDDRRVSLVAGVKNTGPVVVLGMQLPAHSQLKDISVAYPMKNDATARTFVERADEATATRGKADIEKRFGSVIASVSRAFSQTAPSANTLRPNPFETRNEK